MKSPQVWTVEHGVRLVWTFVMHTPSVKDNMLYTDVVKVQYKQGGCRWVGLRLSPGGVSYVLIISVLLYRSNSLPCCDAYKLKRGDVDAN